MSLVQSPRGNHELGTLGLWDYGLRDMAKISKVVKNEKRKVRVALWRERRAEAKKIINNPKSTPEEGM